MSKQLLAIGITIVLLAGCASYSYQDKKEYVRLENRPIGAHRVLNVCRPSNLYQMARRPDIVINDSFVQEIGSGDGLQIYLPSGEFANLEFHLVSYGTGEKMRLKMSVPKDAGEYFYLLTVGFSDTYMGFDARGPHDVLVSNWKLSTLSPQNFLKICGNIPLKSVAHKQLK